MPEEEEQALGSACKEGGGFDAGYGHPRDQQSDTHG